MLNEKNSVLRSVLNICIRTIWNLLMIFLLYESLVQAYSFSYTLFSDTPYMVGQNSLVTITLEEGMSAKEIAEVLYDNRIIGDPKLFIARAYIGKYANRMKAGSYAVNSMMSPEDLCKTFCGIQSEETS